MATMITQKPNAFVTRLLTESTVNIVSKKLRKKKYLNLFYKIQNLNLILFYSKVKPCDTLDEDPKECSNSLEFNSNSYIQCPKKFRCSTTKTKNN